MAIVLNKLFVFGIIFLFLLVGSVSAFGTWSNLSGTDTNDWVGTSTIFSLAFDSINNLTYTGTDSGKFGSYNLSSNVWSNLSGTDVGGWADGINIMGLGFDSKRNIVFTGLASGRFGLYNVSDNVWYDLSATDAGDWAGVSTVYALAVDSQNNFVYTGQNSGAVGLYNVSDNVWYYLFNVGASIRSLTFDSNSSLLYVGANNGKLKSYNFSSNAVVDLSATDAGDWQGTNLIDSLSFDSIDNLVYTCGHSGRFGSYNLSSNVWTNLSGTDTDDWAGTDDCKAMAFDSVNNLVYTGLTSGKFGVYNVSNVADVVPPSIAFISPTDANGSVFDYRDYFFVNISVSDAHLMNSTIFVWNSAFVLLFNQTVNTSYNSLVFSVPSVGVYYFNASAYDSAGNLNVTELYSVAIVNPPISTGYTSAGGGVSLPSCLQGFVWNGVSCVRLVSKNNSVLIVSGFNPFVNVAGDSLLSFNVSYFENNVLSDSNTHFVDVVASDGSILQHVELSKVSTGVYVFSNDFANYSMSNYTLDTHVSGSSSQDVVKVVAFPPMLGLFYDDGVLNVVKLVVAIVVFGFVVSALIFGLVQLIKSV